MKLELNNCLLWGTSTSSAEFKAGDQTVKVDLSEEEMAEMRAVCFRAYDRNRQALADAILTAQPVLLCPPAPPEYEEAEYEPF